MRINVAVTTGAGKPFALRPVDLDSPRGDEILVRIVSVGICHTDIFFRDQEMIPAPAVLGHEGAGVVEAVGSGVTKVKPGDHVALTFRSCGHCARCTESDPAYCATMPQLNYTGTRPDGSRTMVADGIPVSGSFFGQSSFASHALTYERNVVVIPPELDLKLAGPLGCGVQTGAGAIMNSLACQQGSSVLIMGGGPVGLSAVMAARIQGCRRIILVEPLAARRELGLGLGATDVIDPADGIKLGRAVRSLEEGGVTYALDTTGKPDVQRSVLGALASRAVYGIVGLAPPGTPPPGEINDIVSRGITIRGIIEGDSEPDSFIPELINLMQRGDLPIERMVTTFPFDQINEAVKAQHDGTCVKAVLLMPDETGS